MPAVSEEEVEVVVIGSGFGGSVAALRFAEAGHRVLVLERGDRVSREKLQIDLDFFWKPRRAAYGFNDVRKRGSTIVPWLGAAVGGGSHVYAGTLKRRESWEGFPRAIRGAPMATYYQRAEEMMRVCPYPDWPPYTEARATQLLYRAGKRLKREEPELVEDCGPVPLAISFAPKDGKPGERPGDAFVNVHGARQRYYDPSEQSILGGDIDSKNTLDRNYLYLAEQRGAEIRPLCEVDRIEPLEGDRYRIHYFRHQPPEGRARLRRRWLPSPKAPAGAPATVIARHLVVAAGSVGSSELLLRNRDLHKTLPMLGDRLGHRYSNNGDCMTLIVPFRGFWMAWGGFAAGLAGLVLGSLPLAALGLLLYYAGIFRSRRTYDPDIGTTNSDNIRFRARDGSAQGAYIESGRYPTPGKLALAVIISVLTGHFRPRLYRSLRRAARWLRIALPPFEALAHSWPIPLLTMGRDDAFGTFKLDRNGEALIDFDLAADLPFYAWAESLGRKVARAARAHFLPNVSLRWLKTLEVPHNLGGVPMGESQNDGVVDHAGRAFGYRNLMVLDGSIIPVAIGPNPALTILAVSERAVEVALAQLDRTGAIDASRRSPAGAEALAEG
jgi:cholesterol oxidase